MKNNIITLALVFALGLLLTNCGKKDKNKAKNSKPIESTRLGKKINPKQIDVPVREMIDDLDSPEMVNRRMLDQPAGPGPSVAVPSSEKEKYKFNQEEDKKKSKPSTSAGPNRLDLYKNNQRKGPPQGL